MELALRAGGRCAQHRAPFAGHARLARCNDATLASYEWERAYQVTMRDHLLSLGV